MNRREWMTAGVVGLGAAAASASTIAGHEEFSFHHDHILGTSLDVWLVGPNAAAERAEDVVLDEFERLRRVFSLYDPDSELSRLNRSTGPVPLSADLAAVMSRYEHWQSLSGGSCNSRVGALVQLWADAERAGVLPDRDELARLAARLSGPGWRWGPIPGTITRLDDAVLDLNAVAKGYILHSTSRTLRAALPEITAGLINLGGDLTGWGDTSWRLGVQDPFRPEDNARPLTGLSLANAAVATSGGYQRFFTVGSNRFSHLIDPRTGWPADGIASATVLAPDSPAANVLATTLCILSPADGLRLVARVPGAECLIVTARGDVVRSQGFARYEFPIAAPSAADDPKEKADENPWPDQFQVKIAIDLPKLENTRYRRPYVAVWIEDANGKAVRTLTVWGDNNRWIKDLSDWWKVGKDDADLVKAVTRATRGPGKYDVVWDGKNDKGKALPQGTYTVRVEVHREHGKHLRQSGKIKCETEPDKVTLDKNDETNATVVEYKKKDPAKK
jgi:thiamine biosynthesis lipoprotein ApbE